MPVYGGYLQNWETLQDFPEMAQEALLWPQVTLIAWQLISLYYRVPEVHHLGVGASFPNSNGRLQVIYKLKSTKRSHTNSYSLHCFIH